jgi:hypothetical protein
MDYEYLNVRTMEKSKGVQPSDLRPAATKPQENHHPKQGYTMSQENVFSVPENVILQTTNYGMFKFDPLNRAIRQDTLDQLYDAVNKKNLLHLFPIVVTRQFVVVDGQHRLKVAEALNVPIYYIVSGQMQIEDAAQVNMNVAKWNSRDYLDHWCKIGLADYLWFREFWDSHNFLTFSATLKLLAWGGERYAIRDGNLTQLFYGGGFKIKDLAFAGKVAGIALDFSRWVRFYKDSVFVSALTHLASNPSYDHARMMRKMEYLSVRLVRCPDVKSYLQVIGEVYNHGATEDRRVQFSLDNRKRILNLKHQPANK